MKRALWAGLALLALAGPATAAPEFAQARPDTTVDRSALLLRRVESLVRTGRLSDAVNLLEETRRGGGLDAGLTRRLARLYRDLGRHADVEKLLLEGVDGDERRLDVGQLRQLADARFAVGRVAEARRALDRILELGPQDAALIRTVATLLGQQGLDQAAVLVLLQGRDRIGRPFEFAQTLAVLHARAGRAADATREYCHVVIEGPLNVSLMRGQVLELADAHPDQLPAMIEAAVDVADAHPRIPHNQILVAELLLRAGRDREAWRRLSPLLGDAELAPELLRMALAGLADSRLPDAPAETSLRRLELSVRISRGLLGNETLPRVQWPRLYDTLVRSLVAILENPAFSGLETEARAELLEETRLTIVDMQREFAGNQFTLIAMLRLAEVYVDGLRRPREAMEIYRQLTLSPDTPREQLQVARLGLARTHVAVGDTATARELFEGIGADMSFVESQGRAQYHLGLLDFMGGRFATAEDRLKAVAMEQPRAEYTNDALELALVLAEEEFSGDPDEVGLRRYGRALYHRATLATDSLRAELRAISERPASALRDRARLDLGRLERSEKRNDAALSVLARLADDSPRGRFTAVALDERAELLERLGRADDARVVLERLLRDHPDYVMLDRVRDRARALGGGAPAEEEDLP